MSIDDDILCTKYNLNVEDFEGIGIDFDALKIRTSNCLKRAGIWKIQQLLSVSYSKLSEIRSMGLSSLQDIEKYICELGGTLNERQDSYQTPISHKIKARKDLIFKGEFSSELYEGLNPREVVIVNTFKEGHKLIDYDLINLCKENPNSALMISNAFSRFVQYTKKYTEFYKLYSGLGNKIDNYLKPYFDVYSTEFNVSPELYQCCDDDGLILKDLFKSSGIYDPLISEKTKFAKWASYNLFNEVNNFFDEIYSKGSSNVERVIQLRAKKMTLQVIGDELGITRERVRQIEKKVVQPFCRWQRAKKFLPRLSADFNGEKILESTGLQEYFGDVTEVLLYLLQCADDEFFSYDRQTDTIIIVDDDITDFARDFVEKMPDEFDIVDIDDYKQTALNRHDIPVDIFDREISRQYKLSGTHYHRNKLSLVKMYQIVLKKYYPNGMNIYDDTELERFRGLLVNEFGDVSLPQKNRPISAAIGRCCILCGRGRYRVTEHEKIPHELLTKIYEYIMGSDRDLFFMNEIYLEFEDELLEAGIDNRFFLQGVLREKYESDLFFRRDYVSKNSNNLSMYRDLKLFVKKSKYPVTKDQIREAYPGITEIMISVSLSDDDIINYFGSYIHSSNLNLFDYDKKYILRVLQQILYDSMPHHCDEIFETMQNDNPNLLNRLGIYYQYSLFSLLQYFFSEQYEFARPYIAQIGVNINKPIELLQEYVSANEVFQITEFLGLAKEYHYTVYDILKFLNGWNDTHLLINKQEMASIEHIGITEDIACKVERMIIDEMEDGSLISELECIYKLPEINIPWTEWLVYSVINRWGIEVEAHTTSRQFRLSSPVVSKIGEFDRNNYGDSDSGEMAKTIDLNDIDAVTDYIMEDIEIEW